MRGVNHAIDYVTLLKIADSRLVNRCPHRSEIQSIVITETDSEQMLCPFFLESYLFDLLFVLTWNAL